jgi:hypothetical protein
LSRIQQFEGDPAAFLPVQAEEDNTHATAAQGADDIVPIAGEEGNAPTTGFELQGLHPLIECWCGDFHGTVQMG